MSGVEGQRRFAPAARDIGDALRFFTRVPVGDPGASAPLDINRYVFGAEKTFLDGTASVEVRVPFAGTLNSDQIGGQALDLDNAELGNVGLLFKGILLHNANWVVTAGVGLKVGKFSFDAAFQPMTLLGEAFRLGVGWKF